MLRRIVLAACLLGGCDTEECLAPSTMSGGYCWQAVVPMKWPRLAGVDFPATFHHPTAVNGTQHVVIDEAWTLPFRVVTNDGWDELIPEDSSRAFRIAAADPSSFTIEGIAAGRSRLKFLEPDAAAELAVALTIESYVLDHIQLSPDPAKHVFLAGTPLVIRLHGSPNDNTRLVDDSMQVAGDDMIRHPDAWDRLSIAAAAAPGSKAIRITAAARDHQTSLEVVERATGIVRIDDTGTLQIGQYNLVCFSALYGDRPIATPPFTYQAAEHVKLSLIGGVPHCLHLLPPEGAPGTLALTVTSSGTTTVFDLPVDFD